MLSCLEVTIVVQISRHAVDPALIKSGRTPPSRVWFSTLRQVTKRCRGLALHMKSSGTPAHRMKHCHEITRNVLKQAVDVSLTMDSIQIRRFVQDRKRYVLLPRSPGETH